MPKELEMIDVKTGSASIYEDLGLPDAAEMQVKATLAAKIGEIIKHRHLTQIQAAEILGMPQPKLSGMLRGQFRGISEAKMLECMNRLGRDVEIIVRKPSRSRAIGRTSVVFA
jgi:predicted XRE-type DNA-binding protein